jgi:hypothetical protein
MAVIQDKQVMPVLVAIRDALAAELQCAPNGPTARYDIIPRDRTDMRGCECGPGGRTWIRYAGRERIDTGSCVNPYRISAELAILRCLPYQDTGAGPMPSSAQYFKASGDFLGDEAAIRRVLTYKSLTKLGSTGAWLDSAGPYGPQASCMGTIAVVRWRSC